MVFFAIERTFEYAADAERVWPAVAQSNLLTEVIGSGLGSGRYETIDELQADGSVLRRATGDKLGPIAKSWTEDLGEWVYARYSGQRRSFGADGRQFTDLTITLEPVDEKTRVTVRISVNSSKLMVWFAIKSGMLRRGVEHMLGKMASLTEAEILRSSTEPEQQIDPLAHLPFTAPPLDERAAQRLPEVQKTLSRLSGDDKLPARLIDYLTRAPEDFLTRLRPLALARAWRADADQVVDLFLSAHSAGLLSLRWEVLCPR